MKKIFRLTTLTILFIFASCSDDSTPDSKTMTEQLKGKTFYSNVYESAVEINGSKYYEGSRKIDGCYEMTDYKMTISKNTSDILTGIITYDDDVEFTFEFELEGNKLILYFYDEDFDLYDELILTDDCTN